MPRILLAEDDESSADMLARRLRRHGHEVEVVNDGQRALDTARERPFDAILLDMSLPSLDGWKVAAALKLTPATSPVPIIAITAHASSEDRERARAAGCDEFHAKPVDFTRLREQLEALLAARAR